MSFLQTLRFRQLAQEAKISDFGAEDIRWERLVLMMANNLTPYFLNALSFGTDLSNSIQVWNLLGVDSLIRLEDKKGNVFRVAIALRNSENKAYSILQKARKPQMSKMRSLLNIHYYWVLVASDRFFAREDWQDYLVGKLYEEIDTATQSNRRHKIIAL